MIRNPNTKCFRAIESLSAKVRWCLTGTPIHNKIEDLATLVRFLQVPGLNKLSQFKRICIQPIEKTGDKGFDKLRTLLQCICLRRTNSLLELPTVNLIEHEIEFSESERSQYEQVLIDYRKAHDDALCGKNPPETFRSVLQIIMKLRLLCNHGTLPNNDSSSMTDVNEDVSTLLQGGWATCAYCGTEIAQDDSHSPATTTGIPGCSHIVCRECTDKYERDLQILGRGEEVTCPLCSTPLLADKPSTPTRSPVHSVESALSGGFISTKFAKIIADIKTHRTIERW